MSVFNVSALTAYVDQTNVDLIKRSVLEPKTAKIFTIQAGIKSAEALNLLDDTIVFGDGSQCGFTPSGSTTISQRILTVGKIKVQKNYCLKDLEPYFTQLALQKGSHQESFSFEQELTDFVTDKIQATAETSLWQSSIVASGSNPNLNKFDGFFRIIENASGSYINATGSVAGGNLITGSITLTNVRQLIEQNVYGQIPVEILDQPDTAIYVGRDLFRLYVGALANANLFNQYSKDNPDQCNVYGTNMSLIPLNGMNGSSKVVAARKSNMFIGVDLASDSDTARAWYSQDNDEVRFVYDFKLGTQVAFPDQVVYAFVH
jgi:hypothetical protein